LKKGLFLCLLNLLNALGILSIPMVPFRIIRYFLPSHICCRTINQIKKINPKKKQQ